MEELTTKQQKIQQQYLDSFAKEKATDDAKRKHQATIKDLEKRLRSMASTFVTPVLVVTVTRSAVTRRSGSPE